MIADPLNDTALKSRIDTPDFTETLATDSEGAFAADITTYLSAWQLQIKAYQDAGLPSGEFESLTRLSDSIQTAGRVLDFFAKMQKLTASQPSEN